MTDDGYDATQQKLAAHIDDQMYEGAVEDEKDINLTLSIRDASLALIAISVARISANLCGYEHGEQTYVGAMERVLALFEGTDE